MNAPRLRFKEFSGEWEGKKLDNIADLTSSKRVYLSDYVNEGIPFYRGKEISELKRNAKPKDILYITREAYEAFKSSFGVPQVNDILITAVGTLGNVYRIKNDSEFYFKDGNLIWLKSVKISSPFLEILLETNQEAIQKSSIGSSQRALTIVELKKLKFNIPSLPEQTKIANFLTAIDEKISQLTQKYDLLKQYKKGVMQQIFSLKLRFEDEGGREFPEWEEREIGDVFKVTRGDVLSMGLVSETQTDVNQYPVYSSQTKNSGLSGYYNDYLYEDSITWTTDGANAGDVNYRNGKFYCTNVCGVLISNEGFANAFVAAMINAVSKKYVSYVGNPKLMNGVMAKISIEFPCVKEQTKIANFLTAIDDKITHTQTQLDAVKLYKKGLLQQMFV